ncbi:MAG: DUF1440 domain-containing protein [Candidatus Limnocylindria bacterium]
MSGSVALSVAGMLVRGAIAGVAATWLMDVATTGVQKLQPAADADREKAAWPNGQSSVANLVDLLAARLRIRLDEASRNSAMTLAHYALGAVPGALYAVTRDRVPFVGVARGGVYGALLWAVNDEIVNTQLGLAGPWSAYPTLTHIRGLIGHLVLGIGTDVGIDLLGLADAGRSKPAVVIRR